ncbi:Bacterial regulatory protein, luxR family [Aquisphaera giovannonii]|uniref:Bacterial regulatory protein, luxR family n=1 Tax=Aquisphaera giovannonii TaxID=406548 RepID=A0A5B9WF51_9BACT|nr:helix-turn-helix transcriptional regulator [Aquisphaera giovannonii]QEH38581.1 Bacterial regulatory protein, luxR family [Aquisphaera giovannonii]
MPKSSMLRAADVRAIVKLVNECRDLGDDWWAWHRHCIGGLLELTDSELGLAGEGAVRNEEIGMISPPAMLGRPGFEADPSRILEVIHEYTLVPGASRFVSNYFARWREEDGVALTNRDLFGDREWHASVDMQTVGQAYGTDATILCCREIARAGAGSGELEDITLFREMGRRAYTERETTIVHETCAAITSLMGGPLARFREPSPADLPPRARQVLACFLEGDSDKQVARRLGISAHTVNQYAKRIFAHFGVQSRTELLARWIRRGWTHRPPDDLRGRE